MSFKLDDVEPDIDVKELLSAILLKLEILILHHEDINGEKYTDEDITNGYD